MVLSKFQGYLFAKFPNGQITGNDEWNVQCPRCGEPKNKAYININSGRGRCWHCEWRARGWYALIAYVERLPSEAAAEKWFEEHNEFTAFSFEQVLPNAMHRKTMLKRLPPEYVPIDRPEGPFYDYIKGRGISLATIRNYRMGSCSSGYYQGRVIIPVENDGKLEFFFDRAIDKNEERKTLGIGSMREKWPVDKKTVIFNLGNVSLKQTIYIAEGIFTALSLPDCVALLGKSCSDVQFMRLLKDTEAEHFVICLDNGAEKEASRLASRFTQWGKRASIMEFPDKDDANDYLIKGRPMPEIKPWSMEDQVMAAMKGWVKQW